MSTELVIRYADLDEIPLIGYLAQQIWPETYRDLLPPDQLAYMMDLFYSPGSLHKQITVEKHTFLIAELDEEPIGFASFSKHSSPGVFKLHKLYVHSKTQGKGIGKALIEFIIEQVKPQEGHTLQLYVKRDNKARHFYEKLGFTVVREEDNEIGNNYWMRDYVMEKPI